MLQQTRVETVIPYYLRFMERFPTLEALARAPEEEVLRHWAGLGYYRRARMLQQAAARVCESGGAWPQTAAAWRALPGVGEYTAAAIASIAQGERIAVVDGNVKRVASRFLALEHPADSRALHKAAAAWAQALHDTLPEGTHPGDLNQALMELGATVCLPRQPRCAACPVAEGCRGRARGDAESFPRAGEPMKRVDLPLVFLLGAREGRALLRPRRRGWNPGLYEPPSLPDGDDGGLGARFTTEVGAPVRLGAQLATVRHAITHHRIRGRVFAFENWDGRGGVDPASVPLTGLARKILRAAPVDS